MLSKKGSVSGIIAIVFIIVFFLAIIIIGIVIFNKQNSSKQEQVIEFIPLFLMPRDQTTKEPVEAQYLMDYTDKTNIRQITSQGKLDNSWNELTIVKNYESNIYCWNDDYYLAKTNKQPLGEELTKNKSTSYCDMNKIGNLSISHKGDLNNTFNIITITLSSSDTFQKLGYCVSWTSGIISVNSRDYYRICENGFWSNSTKGADGKAVSLPNNQFICNDNEIQQCDKVEGSRCIVESNEKILTRYNGKMDKCWYPGITIRNQSYDIQFEIRTDEFKNRLDKIDLVFFDADRRLNDQGKLEWNYNQEIGAKDYEYEITY